MYVEKLPPHDVDAEEATLGSLLIDPDAIYKVDTFLKPEDFYRENNQWVYEACSSLARRDETIDQITVARELSREGKLEAAGGAAYLSHLVAVTPTSVNVEHYAQIVYRLAIMRHLINAGSQIASIGYEADPDVDAAISKAENILFKIRHAQSSHDFIHIGSILDQYFEESISPSKRKRPTHVRTGFPALDGLLGNLQRSDMIILGARPSLGKSSLALNIARNAAVEQGACVAIFSLEMSQDQLAQRLVSSESAVVSERIRLGMQSEAEEKRIMDAIGILSEAPIYVDDSPILTVGQLHSKARRLDNEQSVDFIIVDYLQLVHSNEKSQNPVQEMSQVSRALKAIARDIDVPLLAVSQLSRAVMQRNRPRIPQLSDLRESGSIEQDADVVLLMYRPDKDYSEEEWAAEHPGEPYPRGITDIEVAKHRNGPIGRGKLYFRESLTKFDNLELQRSAT